MTSERASAGPARHSCSGSPSQTPAQCSLRSSPRLHILQIPMHSGQRISPPSVAPLLPLRTGRLMLWSAASAFASWAPSSCKLRGSSRWGSFFMRRTGLRKKGLQTRKEAKVRRRSTTRTGGWHWGRDEAQRMGAGRGQQRGFDRNWSPSNGPLCAPQRISLQTKGQGKSSRVGAPLSPTVLEPHPVGFLRSSDFLEGRLRPGRTSSSSQPLDCRGAAMGRCSAGAPSDARWLGPVFCLSTARASSVHRLHLV